MVPMFVPIVFHNLEGYDSHLFVKSLGLTAGDINCIPKTDKKYISFTKKIPMETYKDVRSDGSVVEKTIHLEMRFIDSLKFTLKSLDSLVSTLRKDQFKTLTNQMISHLLADNRSQALDLLKKKGVLDLISDPNMYLMIEKGIRGGVSTVTKRYAKANNKYLNNYDPACDSIYLPYLDANNLYGWAMCQKLPVKDFTWMTVGEISDWRNTPCILEVDLEYPNELHDFHNEYPLAPEKICVNKICENNS